MIEDKSVNAMVVGLFLLLGSVIYTVVSKKTQIITIAFDGTALLGIIASLITNLTSSIEKIVRLKILFESYLSGKIMKQEL